MFKATVPVCFCDSEELLGASRHLARLHDICEQKQCKAMTHDVEHSLYSDEANEAGCGDGSFRGRVACVQCENASK